MCNCVGEVRGAETGVEDRDPCLRRRDALTLDPRYPAGVRARGVELVVAVLDHRTACGVLADRTRLYGDAVAGAQISRSHQSPFVSAELGPPSPRLSRA